jgi:hypothetical protein
MLQAVRYSELRCCTRTHLNLLGVSVGYSKANASSLSHTRASIITHSTRLYLAENGDHLSINTNQMSEKKLTPKDIGLIGGKERWKRQKLKDGPQYKQKRSDMMREVVRARYAKRGTLKSK